MDRKGKGKKKEVVRGGGPPDDPVILDSRNLDTGFAFAFEAPDAPRTFFRPDVIYLPPPRPPRVGGPVLSEEEIAVPMISQEALLASEVAGLRFALDRSNKELSVVKNAYNELVAETREYHPRHQIAGGGIIGGTQFHSQTMAEQHEEIMDLRRALQQALDANESHEKNYTDLESKFAAELAEHDSTKKKLALTTKRQELTHNVFDVKQKELAVEIAENTAAKARIEELERVEKNQQWQIDQLNESVKAHQAKVRNANQTVRDRDNDSAGISALLSDSQKEVEKLIQQLIDAEDRERRLVYENEQFKDLKHIDANVRESLSSFVDNPEARFPLDPNTFHPHLRSPIKNRVVSSARSLADELENTYDESSSESGSEGGRSRRASNASDGHVGVDRPRSASPHDAAPKFTVYFHEELPTTESTIKLILSEVVAARTLNLPLSFLDSGIVTFSEHEITPPQPQYLSLTVPGTFEEITPSPVPSPVTLSSSQHATQEVVPESPVSPIQVEQTPPVHLSCSGIQSQDSEPIPVNHNLSLSSIRSVLRLVPPVPVKQSSTRSKRSPVVLTQSGIFAVADLSPSDPPVLTQTAGILEVVSQAPGPAIILDDASTQTFAISQDHVSTQTPAVAQDNAGTQTPAIVHDNAGTQTIPDPTPIPPVQPDAPHASAVHIVHVPYETINHDPVACWMTVEVNSWQLICMLFAWLWSWFTVSKVSNDTTPTATAQAPRSAQTNAGNEQTRIPSPQITTRIADEPWYFRRRVSMAFFAQMLHFLIYFCLIWALVVLNKRQMWFNANETTRSFLTDILAYRAHPEEHASFWNPSYWAGHEVVLKGFQTFLLFGQNIDLFQLKSNYIPG